MSSKVEIFKLFEKISFQSCLESTKAGGIEVKIDDNYYSLIIIIIVC